MARHAARQTVRHYLTDRRAMFHSHRWELRTMRAARRASQTITTHFLEGN